MTDSNPYASPKSDLRVPGRTGGRPRWVWVIFIFYVFSAVATLFSFYAVYSGAITVPEEQKRYLADLTVFDHVLSFGILGINLVAAVQLFRLRRVSVYLFAVALGLGVLMTTWRISTKGWLVATGGSGSSVVFGWAIAVAVCLYAWRLARKGVLK